MEDDLARLDHWEEDDGTVVAEGELEDGGQCNVELVPDGEGGYDHNGGSGDPRCQRAAEQFMDERVA